MGKHAGELTPDVLNEIRIATYTNADDIFRVCGASIPAVDFPLPEGYSRGLVHRDATKRCVNIAHWIAREIHEGVHFEGREIGALLCLRCDNEFRATIEITNGHGLHCLWHYYAVCRSCGYQNNIAKYYPGEAHCRCRFSRHEALITAPHL